MNFASLFILITALTLLSAGCGSDSSPASSAGNTPTARATPGPETVAISGPTTTNGTTSTSTNTATNGSGTGVATSSTAYQSGPVGPAVSGKSYSACHHDYFYFADSSANTHGLLFFKHQQNGTADEGSGTTGFNIWTVDISDFYLNSEVGSVTYCQMHWDFSKKTLSYQVWDTQDGFYGKTGVINF